MWRNRFLAAAGVLALASGGAAQSARSADLGGLPPEEPPAYEPPPPAPPQAYLVPPPVVIYGFMRPFPYRPYGCGGCSAYAGYPYYVPSANHPPSYYRPYYNHHLGLETNCGFNGAYASPGVSPGWGGYGYK